MVRIYVGRVKRFPIVAKKQSRRSEALSAEAAQIHELVQYGDDYEESHRCRQYAESPSSVKPRQIDRACLCSFCKQRSCNDVSAQHKKDVHAEQAEIGQYTAKSSALANVRRTHHQDSQTAPAIQYRNASDKRRTSRGHHFLV